MKILEEIEGLVSSKICVIKTIISIIKLETRLAGLSIYPLLLNICMLLVVLIAMWGSTMLLLGYLVIFVSDSNLLAIISILLLNSGLFLGLLKYLMFNLKKMSFEKTREYIAKRESQDDKQEKEIDYANCNDGKNITIPTN